MRRIVAPALVLAALIVALAPSVATAADAREYQLQLTPASDLGTAQMIVTAMLDPETSLPATISVPVPTGATLLWCGELLGGAPSDDPAREASVKRVGTMDVYTFTLEESYIGQVEVEFGPAPVKGTKVAFTLAWTNPGAEALVTASVVVEPNASKVAIAPEPAGETRTNDLGESLYPLGVQRLATGGAYAIDVSWRRGGGEFPLLAVVGAVLVLAVVALFAVLAAERTRARRAAVRERRGAPETPWE